MTEKDVVVTAEGISEKTADATAKSTVTISAMSRTLTDGADGGRVTRRSGVKKMADILIKGMEMPTMPETFKQGERVPYIDVRIFADGTAVTSKCERPYYTQYSAVPIPPHGDLIDAQEEMRLMRPCDYDTYDDYNRAFDMLDNAPTIIKASEGGE